MKPIIAITAGDINGVGYEIILKSLSDSHVTEVCTPVVYGNIKALKAHLMTLDAELHNLQFNVVQRIEDVRDGKLNLLTCYPDDTPLCLGESTAEAGKASFLSLQRACQDIKAGKAQALITAPINKANIQSDQFRFSGHTEYLDSVFADGNHECLMMMVSECMRVALVCNHAPITQVPGMISEERILAKLRILHKTLQSDFLIRRPRIAVLALNPHAGDNGLIGKEETEVIRPTIEKANAEGIDTFGPYSADGFFGAGKYIHFDAVLAMYHDQGLIPFKSLDMSGVNFTAGLPIVRTSPDHGTAYDLAGKNQASALSFNHALFTALDILHNRAVTEEINRDPLVIREQPHPERPSGRFFIPPKEEFHD
ncbi:MAG: 4-hydroxythreonine-4-phosphate dehydrogenase PdxA [Paludibacteraceae bacterium]|nr:4-hydroxythreonine-4-phosphate dehydrogenase PdxA [Paludibacteraceae bacterium]